MIFNLPLNYILSGLGAVAGFILVIYLFTTLRPSISGDPIGNILQNLRNNPLRNPFRRGGGRGTSNEEKSVVNESGLASAQQTAQQAESVGDALQAQGVAEAEAEVGRAEAAPKDTAKSEKEEEHAAAMGADAAETLEGEAASTATLTKHSVGMLAGIMIIQKALDNYLSYESTLEATEAAEIAKIETLATNIGSVTNMGGIDQAMLIHLRSYLVQLDAELKKERQAVSDREKGVQAFFDKLDKAVRAINNAADDATAARERLAALEKIERNDFKAEINDLLAALKAKQSELRKAQSQRTGADRSVIAQLMKEIELLNRQVALSKKLQASLLETYKMLDKELLEAQAVLKKIVKTARQTRSFENGLQRIRRIMETKYKAFDTAFTRFTGAVQSAEQSRNVYDISLRVSRELNNLIRAHKALGFVKTGFDRDLVKVIGAGIEMTKLANYFEGLIVAMEESEKAAGQGMLNMTKLMQLVLGDAALQSTEEEVARTLSEMRTALDSQERVAKSMKGIATELQARLNALIERVKKLVEIDTTLSNYLERASQTLGSLLAVGISRKVAIDEQYLKKADQFADQLRSENQFAANAFQQARTTMKKPTYSAKSYQLGRT